MEAIFLVTVYIKELDEKNILEKTSTNRLKAGNGSHLFFFKRSEKSKQPSFPKFDLTSFLKVFSKCFNRIQINEIEKGKKIYIIPKPNKTSIYKKILKKLEKEKTQTEKVQIVLSNKIKNYAQYFEGCKILDGKPIFLSSIEAILKEILQENSLELQDLYILTNYYQEKNINLIRNFATKVKTINVVTKEIEKYKIIEEMLEKQGISIVISNNKRKSLKKAKIIINMDFSGEELNQYIIFRNAVIINITQEKLTKLKGFEGITIRDIQLRLKEDEKEFIRRNKLEGFRQIEIYESLKNNLSELNKIEIDKLYGNNGQIDKKELENIRINFCELCVKN